MFIFMGVHTCAYTHIHTHTHTHTHRFPRCLSGKESTCQCRRRRLDPWVGKIPWRRKWLPTPVFLPGEFHGQRSLVSYSPWGHKESDMTQRLILWVRTYSFEYLSFSDISNTVGRQQDFGKGCDFRFGRFGHIKFEIQISWWGDLILLVWILKVDLDIDMEGGSQSPSLDLRICWENFQHSKCSCTPSHGFLLKKKMQNRAGVRIRHTGEDTELELLSLFPHRVTQDPS